ncbi:hypothetical protein [Vibrio phage phiKT1019]|nr:hypothetical protein [Vibrio phage phiKT1019]
MNADLPDSLEDIDVSKAVVYQHQHYWCVVEKREGKWFGYVGSSGKGNQRTKYTAFKIFRPVHSNMLVSVLFEYLTNSYLFTQTSRRSYKFTLGVLKHLLEQTNEHQWTVLYRNHNASLYLGHGRKLGIKVKGRCNLSLNIDDWIPTILHNRVYHRKHSFKELLHV